MEPPQVMRVKDAADYLGISEQAVRKACTRKWLKAQQTPSGWVLELADVQEYASRPRHLHAVGEREAATTEAALGADSLVQEDLQVPVTAQAGTGEQTGADPSVAPAPRPPAQRSGARRASARAGLDARQVSDPIARAALASLIRANEELLATLRTLIEEPAAS